MNIETIDKISKLGEIKNFSDYFNLQNIYENILIFYQPIIMCKKEKEIFGLEALIRWDHPQYGIIFPKDFINLFYKSDDMLSLGSFIYNKAISDVNFLRKNNNENLLLSINVSAKEILNQGFIDRLSFITKKYDMDFNYLNLEISEGDVLKNFEAYEFMVKKLKKLGIKITIDNYVGKFLDLDLLSKIHVDMIKIDKSLVENISSDINKILVFNMIKDFHKINVKVISVGIENSYQYNMLKELGSDFFQGFYCAPAFNL